MPDQPIEPPASGSHDPGMEPRVAVLEQIAADTRASVADLRAEMADLRAEMRAGFADLRAEIRAIRTDFGAEMRAMRGDFRWLLGLMLAAIAGILTLIAHGFHWIP